MKKSIRNISIIIVLAGILISAGIAFYMFNMPHRNVQNTKVDYSLTSTELVNEYLANTNAANQKYLNEEGESKILAVTGTVFEIRRDLNDQKVIVLKTENDNAGVSCTFTIETNMNAEKLAIGSTVTVKGVIRSGAGYDEDLDMYENVIMEKCDIVK